MRTLKFDYFLRRKNNAAPPRTARAIVEGSGTAGPVAMSKPAKLAGKAAAGDGGVPAPPRVTVKGSEKEAAPPSTHPANFKDTSPVSPSNVVEPLEKNPAPRIEAVPPSKLLFASAY